MIVNHYVDERALQIIFNEEIDHHVQEKIRRNLDYEIQRFMPKKIVFDFENVNFMDSAGIGIIIGRYKVAKMYGAQIQIVNANEKITKILEMSGIPKIIQLSTNYDNKYCKNI